MPIQEVIEEIEARPSCPGFSCFEKIDGHCGRRHRCSSFKELRHSVDVRQHVHNQVPGGVGTQRKLTSERLDDMCLGIYLGSVGPCRQVDVVVVEC